MMNKNWMTAWALALVWTVAAWGGDKPPATLPAGHPDISTMMKGGPASKGSGALPQGHPDVSMMKKGPSAKPGPGAVVGTIKVRATQGTAGGPAVGADKLTIELYHRGQVLDKIESKLEANGTAVVKDVPLTVPFQPLLKVHHAGVEYSAVGLEMDGQRPEQEVQITVYETTEQAPAWTMKMRHVVVTPAKEGLVVMDMFAIENPVDRAWIGVADSKGGRRTLALPLPPGVVNVQALGGFHDCCVKMEDGALVNTMALIPGTSQYQLQYVVPAKADQAALTLTAPAPIKHMMVFVPEDGTTVTVQGLQDMGVKKLDRGNTRFYKVGTVAAGQSVGMTVSKLSAAPAMKAEGPEMPVIPAGGNKAAAVAASSGHVAQIAAGVGAGVILLVGVGFMFKPRRKA